MSDPTPSMERIWAPWRIEYVRNDDKEEECFLCRAWEEDNDRDNLVLWRTDHSMCILNRWPYNNGHTLVAPRVHKGDISDMEEHQLLDQMKCIQRCKDVLSRAVEPDGFNVSSAASDLYKGLPMHCHVVPLCPGYSNFVLTCAGTKVIPESLYELWELLQQVDTGDSEPEQ